jgi:KaiC/GvpD/RAD55 family RecA-like ATPase/CheY-like chemotaxis protein
MILSSGIEPLDRRVGGVRAGGVYVVAGTPGSGKLISTLQFVDAGIRAGERAALLSGAKPERLLEQARQYGLQLEGAWRSGQLRLVGFAPDFERRLTSAPDPQDVFDELSNLVGHDVTRLGIDPGKPLWETRAGTALSSRFVNWAEKSGITVWATLGGDLRDTLSPASEWVLQSASGVFRLERLPTGLLQLWVHRSDPPVDSAGPITLELNAGRALQAPAARLDRRRTDAPLGSERRMVLLQLARELPTEISNWARRQYDVTTEHQPLRVVSRLQDGAAFGSILVYIDKQHAGEAVEACRAIRPLTGAPIIVAADDKLRATDRTSALDAGANDFLSDNFSLVELASRLERATLAGRGLASHRESLVEAVPLKVTEILDRAAFAKAVDARLAEPAGDIFTLLIIRATGGAGTRLGEVLLDQIRGELGDLVGETQEGYGVVLQGARPTQTGSFLDRVSNAFRQLSTNGYDLDVQILSGTSEAERIALALQAER